MNSRYRRRNDSRLKAKARRDFLKFAGFAAIALGMTNAHSAEDRKDAMPDRDLLPGKTAPDPQTVTLFLCGDVMTGRGIDQILPYPNDPRLYEPSVTSAQDYVRLAEKVHGPIPRPVDFAYPWGDALEELRRFDPDVRIVNLETAITTHPEHWPRKGVHYRMHPKNIPCLTAAKIDCCVLANNHVLDWGYPGLKETLTTLAAANVKVAGAGKNRTGTEAPAVMEAGGKGRVLVFGFGDDSSGIPWLWDALDDRPGVNLLPDLSGATAGQIGDQISEIKRKGDCVVASIHWGGNWGYEIPDAQRDFAHRLIDLAGVDVVHGHSSHHPKGIEVYKSKPILYGCGDFLNDYEGIPGNKEFRGDLSLMYFVTLDLATGKLVSLIMTPLQIRRFRLNYAQPHDALWLQQMLDRESRALDAKIESIDQGRRLALSSS
jgi:poly-gamma-glutamate capsule biosynthesis protein CapA/YwtB (metallophosphatase superfamily)